MLEYLDQLDKQLFLWLNGQHNAVMDEVMWQFSAVAIWIPLYLFILGMVIYRYRKASWPILVGFGLLVGLCDQVSLRFKHGTERHRPSHEPTLKGQVHIVNNYHGGAYGFFSGHATNSFGVAGLTWLVLSGQSGWWAAMFVWAALVAYSRVYLGVHYPGDILVGALVGLGFAQLVFALIRLTWRKTGLTPSQAD